MTFKDVMTKVFNAPVADENKVDKKELAMGMEVEKEHSSNPKVREKISLAHLREIKTYYTRLRKMEKEAKEK